MEDAKFCMPIDDIFHVRERGLVVTGRIEKGEIRIGDIVYFETVEGELIRDKVTLEGIDTFGTLTYASEGFNVGLFFKVPYIKNLTEGLHILPIKVGDIVKK